MATVKDENSRVNRSSRRPKFNPGQARSWPTNEELVTRGVRSLRCSIAGSQSGVVSNATGRRRHGARAPPRDKSRTVHCDCGSRLSARCLVRGDATPDSYNKTGLPSPGPSLFQSPGRVVVGRSAPCTQHGWREQSFKAPMSNSTSTLRIARTTPRDHKVFKRWSTRVNSTAVARTKFQNVRGGTARCRCTQRTGLGLVWCYSPRPQTVHRCNLRTQPWPSNLPTLYPSETLYSWCGVSIGGTERQRANNERSVVRRA
jgi:hypothetical protein